MPSLYHLVATVGLDPASLTRVAWALAQAGHTPAAVHVLTTARGADRLRDALLRGGLSSRWSRLCREILGRDDDLEPRIHIAQRDGRSLADVRTRDDDLDFGQMAYQLVRQHTDEPDDLPVVGSIAGGRRTMGAQLTSAFALCGRPVDRLVHIHDWADPDGIAPAFWPGDGGENLTVDLTWVPYPRLRPVIEEPFVKRIGERYGLRNVMDVLSNYNVVGAPDSVRVWLTRGHQARCRVEILADDGEVLADSDFTPRMVSILLLLADQLEIERRRADASFGLIPNSRHVEATLVNHPVSADRVDAVYEWCAQPRDATRVLWPTPSHVSQAISRYRDADGLGSLDIHPFLQEHLDFTPTLGRDLPEEAGEVHDAARYWHWETFQALPITVVAPEGTDSSRMRWPFRTIPEPVPAHHLGRPGTSRR